MGSRAVGSRAVWWVAVGLCVALLAACGGEEAADEELAEPAAAALEAATTGGAVGEIFVSYGNSCALLEGGGVACWGANELGQLGDGSTTDRARPVAVVGLGGAAVAVSGGLAHACALLDDGGVECWGQNYYGQLGDGSTTDSLTPVRVQGLAGPVRALSVEGWHSCALLETGEVQCWGDNNHGQLGEAGGDLCRGNNQCSPTPVTVAGLPGEVAAISAGGAFVCALPAAEAGAELLCWGANYVGQLGDGSTTDSATPAAVQGLGGDVLQVEAGETHACALLEGGGVQCWGRNSVGQLGDGSLADSLTPVQVLGLESGVAALSASFSHSCALLEGGDVQCWGYNWAGQLGDGTQAERLEPVAVQGLDAAAVTVGVGEGHSCALLETGGVQCWGVNDDGQLGNGSTTNSATPVAVEFGG